MTVTLADVAARAQVSPATVSRVLNGNYPVAASTRERVLRAVDELDYVLNGPASALAAATSDLVGILVNDIADPFFGIMASAIQAEIGGPGGRAGGERLAVVCNTGGSPERELTYLTLLQRQRAAAVVLTGGAVEEAPHAAAVAGKLRKLADAGTRVVLCGRPPAPDTRAVALTFDNRGGARALTDHLIGLGHRRLGYIAGPGERNHHPAPAGGSPRRARGGRHRGGPAPHGPRPLRPPLRLRGHAGAAAPRPLPDGDRRRERLRRARRLRRAARVRPAHPRGRLGGRLRRPALQHRRGAAPDDGPAAAVGGGGAGRPLSRWAGRSRRPAVSPRCGGS